MIITLQNSSIEKCWSSLIITCFGYNNLTCWKGKKIENTFKKNQNKISVKNSPTHYFTLRIPKNRKEIKIKSERKCLSLALFFLIIINKSVFVLQVFFFNWKINIFEVYKWNIKVKSINFGSWCVFICF